MVFCNTPIILIAINKRIIMKFVIELELNIDPCLQLYQEKIITINKVDEFLNIVQNRNRAISFDLQNK